MIQGQPWEILFFFFSLSKYTFSPQCNKYVNTFGAIIILVNVRISMRKSGEPRRSWLKCGALGALGLTQLLWATTDYKTPTSSPCLCHELHFSLLAFYFGALCRSESRRKRFVTHRLWKNGPQNYIGRFLGVLQIELSSCQKESLLFVK